MQSLAKRCTNIEVTLIRLCSWMLETNLRSGEDQWFPKVSMHLSSQDVEVVGWCGALSELEINRLSCQIIE